MATPAPVSPIEQAKLLRKIAEEIERDGVPLPSEVLAPIADLDARRLERTRSRAKDALRSLQGHALEHGLDKLTEDEVGKEIAAARADLRGPKDGR